jgi:aryl-alcohol dehydrogenase (NADP+)
VIQCCEESLRRLGTDYIDILYLHKEDHETPLAETVRALAALQRDGKIRYFGVSNHRAWRIAEICQLCDQMGIDRPVVNQPYYHALYRVAEVEQLPACANYGVGVVSYSPLARGVLTGKYVPGTEAAKDSRAGRADKRMLETEFRPETLEAAQTFKRYADQRGVPASHLAVAWVLNNRLITGVIGGPRTEAQWDDYLKAVDVTFTKEDEAFVDQLVVTGHAAAPGYNDPQYPIEGRAARVS